VRLEVTEHLVRISRDRMASHAVRPAEEDQGSPLLRKGHRAEVTTRKAVERRICRSQGDLKLSDRPSPHADSDCAWR
jgi:hypothetical protein